METGASISSASDGETEALPTGRTPQQLHQFWQKEKSASDKRMRKFTKQGNKIVDRYLDMRTGEGSDGSSSVRGDEPFRLNLFHTNISTMLSMLYGSTPKIEVAREHHDPDDDVARVAALLYKRILEADVQSSGDTLSTTLKAALQDRLLPGIGTARVHYDYTSETVPTINPSTMDVEDAEHLTGEWCTCDYVHWQDFAWGWGRTWSEVPWLGYRSYISKDEATERFGEKVADQLDYKQQLPTGSDEQVTDTAQDQKSNLDKAEIWEYWHKKERRVYWFSESVDMILDSVEDPLNLDGFFPSPMPMVANLTTTLFMPRADFVLAQDLYNEVDQLSTRISIITRAVKVVGCYDRNASAEVGRMLNEGVENDLIPVDNWAMFAEKGGLSGVIDWFPVQEVVNTLDTLQQIRDKTIELLYQVTGMSDILRGANTDQYTSDGTQQLKAKFGSVRVQALQDQFAQFASDLDALKAEVISKHFSPESILVQSNANFLPSADMELVSPAVELMQSQEAKWRVNIRPESIAMVDYAQLKSERTEFLMALATYIQSAQAAVKQIPGSLPILLELMKWGMAGFKGSEYLEGSMDKAIEEAVNAPPPQDENDNKQQEAELEQMRHRNEMEKIQAKGAADQQLQNQKFQNEMSKAQQDHQSKMAQALAKTQGDMQRIRVDLKADLEVIAAKLGADLRGEESQAENAAAELQVGHENSLVEMAVEHENTMTEMEENAKVETRPDNT